MPVGFASGGVDFDDLFDPDVVGDGPTAPALTAGGVPLKYAALAYGSKRADVGYAQGGVDVSNLWAAKGTASYVTDGGLPGNLWGVEYRPLGVSGSASASFSFRASGLVGWTYTGLLVPGVGTWTAEPASNFDVQYNVQGGFGNAPSGTFNTWLQLNADRAVSLSQFGLPAIVSGATIRVRIRRRSTGAVLVDRLVDLLAAVEEA